MIWIGWLGIAALIVLLIIDALRPHTLTDKPQARSQDPTRPDRPQSPKGSNDYTT